MKTPDWIGLLEASYDLRPVDTDSWLRSVLKQVERSFDYGLSVGVMLARYTPNTFDVVSLFDTGPPGMCEWARAMNAQAPPEFLSSVYKSGTRVGTFSQDMFPRFPEMQAETLRSSGGLVQDVIGVCGHTGTGYVVTISALCRKPTTPTALERRCWPRAAAHLAAGLRLRLALKRALDVADVDAVLDPGGETCEAKPAAQSPRIREVLRRAVKRIDRARTRAGQRDVAASLEAWQGLIEGRWSLVDHFDSDGKRFVLAIKNDPEHPDPRGLTAQERQSTEFLGLGQSSKSIAYTLGISAAAVSAHLTNARLKLGLASRADLATFFSPSGARARLAEVAVGGEQLLVGAYPLCNEHAVAQLTPAERAVVAYLVCGSTNQDIAERRGTSARTIANQVQAIFRKLRVQSRVELATQLQSGSYS